MIAPKMQRRSITTHLLGNDCTDAAKDGFDFVKAYADKILNDTDGNFREYLTMYENCGFFSFAEQEGKTVVRKVLK